MIKEIKLKRLKSFEDPRSMLFGRVNLLTGKNGRGKSTVLQSLLLLSQSFDAERGIDHLNLNGRFVNLGTFNDVLRRNSGDTFEINFKTDDEVDNDIHCEFGMDEHDASRASLRELKVDGNSKMETVTSSELLMTEEGETILAEDGAPLLLGQEHKTVGATSDVMGLRQLIEMAFISADRIGGVNSARSSGWQQQMGTGVHGEYVMNMLESASKEQKDEINDWLRKVLEGGRVRTETNSANDEILMYIDPAGTDEGFRPSNVGFGYSYILSILVAMVMAQNGTKIMIENPEAHLHPSAQANLVTTIIQIAVAKDMQVFIESHSDHVLHGLQLAVMTKAIEADDLSVLFFDFEKNMANKTVFRQLAIKPDGHIVCPPDGFFDQAEQDLSMLVGI